MTAVRTDYDPPFCGGRWDRSSGSERTPVVSPPSAQMIGSVPSGTTTCVESIVGARPTS